MAIASDLPNLQKPSVGILCFQISFPEVPGKVSNQQTAITGIFFCKDAD